MMDSMIIGKYVPGTSFVHRLDPRTKLLSIFFFVFIVFFANNYITYGLLGVFTILVVMVSQVPLYFILKGMKPILWIVLFTFILHIFMTKDGALLFHFGFLNIYEEGLKQGIFISL
ncbi:energy-coupling factor transporter transmembrane protein EcfT, partial [Bacillus altitudinis]|nr:energy-coupling factor transporter transmembrane protein EcfT [Bacillus altitudinis]